MGNATSTISLGDFNRDGQTSAADITVMFTALADVYAYQATKGLSDPQLLEIGDLNGDGAFNNKDIQPLLDLIASTESESGVGAKALQSTVDNNGRAIGTSFLFTIGSTTEIGERTGQKDAEPVSKILAAMDSGPPLATIADHQTKDATRPAIDRQQLLVVDNYYETLQTALVTTPKRLPAVHSVSRLVASNDPCNAFLSLPFDSDWPTTLGLI